MFLPCGSSLGLLTLYDDEWLLLMKRNIKRVLPGSWRRTTNCDPALQLSQECWCQFYDLRCSTTCYAPVPETKSTINVPQQLTQY